MTLEQFKAIWLKAQEAINAGEKHFSELDAATGGDGDHGTAIVAALKAGEKVQIVGLGGFEVKERAARAARNPRTGEEIQIAASKSVSFKPGKALKDEING